MVSLVEGQSPLFPSAFLKCGVFRVKSWRRHPNGTYKLVLDNYICNYRSLQRDLINSAFRTIVTSGEFGEMNG
jgi:hypothetical protein